MLSPIDAAHLLLIGFFILVTWRNLLVNYALRGVCFVSFRTSKMSTMRHSERTEASQSEKGFAEQWSTLVCDVPSISTKKWNVARKTKQGPTRWDFYLNVCSCRGIWWSWQPDAFTSLIFPNRDLHCNKFPRRFRIWLFLNWNILGLQVVWPELVRSIMISKILLVLILSHQKCSIFINLQPIMFWLAGWLLAGWLACCWLAG